MSYTVVGVIGHIDHGKTSLVAALTGVDTDTHPEEKQRGITIDLGFASFRSGEHIFAMIDAPGHQKYVGNLLAGVASVDVGLLVVACDQGIEAQTLEHALILHLMGVERIVVALTRIDLANQQMQVSLREELELFLSDFGFYRVPVIPISSPNGTGIDDLKKQLSQFACQPQSRVANGYFRMPADRVFTMPGRGCVIAGTIWSGVVNVGDRLQLVRNGQVLRIREIEVHGESVQTSGPGCRTALNVAGVSANEVHRGDELVQPDVFAKSRHFLVELKTWQSTPILKCPTTLQLHTAATACSARITGARRLQPSQSLIVAVETDSPVVATFGQRFLFRLPHPVGTLGGATVLASFPTGVKRSRKLIELGEQLALSDPSDRIVAWADFLGEVEPLAEWCELQLGISPEARTDSIAAALVADRLIRVPGSSRLISRATFDLIVKKLIGLLARQSEEAEDAWLIEESVVQRFKGPFAPELVRWCVQKLVDDQVVVRLGRVVAIASKENSLSKKQQIRMALIMSEFDGNRSPPSLGELSDRLQISLTAVTSLTRFAIQAGMLLDLSGGLLLSEAVFRDLCRELDELFLAQTHCAVAEIRDHWQVTRKHAIPFLEYCDRIEATRRHKNTRIAGSQLKHFACLFGVADPTDRSSQKNSR